MKRLILLGPLFLLTIHLIFGQDNPGFYTNQWSEVHKYELKYLPKSALAITDSIFADEVRPAVDYYKSQSATYWQNFGLYIKGMVAIEKFRSGQEEIARPILNSLKETGIINKELGMYASEFSSHSEGIRLVVK